MNDIPLFTTTNGLAGVRFHVNPLARTTDPETSHAAAASVRLRSGSQKAKLLAAFSVGGPAIAERAARIANLDRTGYWKRASELIADGLLEPTGETQLSSAGERCRVLRITEAGRAVIREAA